MPRAQARGTRRATLCVSVDLSQPRQGRLKSWPAPPAGKVHLINADQRAVIETLASWPPDAWARAVAFLVDGQTQIRRYVHAELATENALLQVSRLRPSV